MACDGPGTPGPHPSRGTVGPSTRKLRSMAHGRRSNEPTGIRSEPHRVQFDLGRWPSDPEGGQCEPGQADPIPWDRNFAVTDSHISTLPSGALAGPSACPRPLRLRSDPHPDSPPPRATRSASDAFCAHGWEELQPFSNDSPGPLSRPRGAWPTERSRSPPTRGLACSKRSAVEPAQAST